MWLLPWVIIRFGFVVAISAAAATAASCFWPMDAAAWSAIMMVFVSIWWAWMNVFHGSPLTFDNDDVPYRIAVLCRWRCIDDCRQCRGAFEGHWLPMVFSYTVFASCRFCNGLPAGRHNPHLRSATTRYALGILS